MNESNKLRSRFDYSHGDQKDDLLAKKRRELERFTHTKDGKYEKNMIDKKVVGHFIRNMIAIIIVLIAILFTWFTHYPEPPISPLLHSWQDMGKYFYYRQENYRIFYIDKMTNNTNGPILLYLHGYPTSNLDLYKILPKLSMHFSRIIAPDFLGFGFSDKPKSHKYSIFDQAELIQTLIKYLDIDNVHILSHDYGDTVAQQLLSLNKKKLLPFNIKSVCMMNGGIFPSHHRPVIFQKLLRIPIIDSIVIRLMNRYFVYIGMTSVFGTKNPPTIAELYDMWKLIRHNDGYLILNKLLAYIDERFENEDEWIDAIRDTQSIPLLFIYGPADPVNPPPFDEFYRSIINRPNIKVLDSNIGHYPQLESPDDVMESYRKFLSENNFL